MCVNMMRQPNIPPDHKPVSSQAKFLELSLLGADSLLRGAVNFEHRYQQFDFKGADSPVLMPSTEQLDIQPNGTHEQVDITQPLGGHVCREGLALGNGLHHSIPEQTG